MKKILANTVYSDATLKSWKKEDLIEHIRVLEHNWQSALESLNNSAENCKKLHAENQEMKDDNDGLRRIIRLIDDVSDEELDDATKVIKKFCKKVSKETAEKCIEIIKRYVPPKSGLELEIAREFGVEIKGD